MPSSSTSPLPTTQQSANDDTCKLGANKGNVSPSVLAYPTNNQMSKVSSELVNTQDITHYFFPLFYAGERGALGIWDKQTGLGHIKRRIEDGSVGTDFRSRKYQYHVLELVNPHSNTGTFITAPRGECLGLHLTLPHFVMIVKNFRRNFCFEILVLDGTGTRRRFCFATWYNPLNLKKFPFLCQVPLKLEVGWNELHINLEELTRSTYRTKYLETIKIQVNANCRLRQIFFCDEEVMAAQLPVPSMRSFQNVRLITPDYGPLNHPDYLESGPEKHREHLIPEPPLHPLPTRIEKDLQFMRQLRFEDIAGTKMFRLYKSYFRDLIREKQLALKQAAKDKKESADIEKPPLSAPSILWDENDSNRNNDDPADDDDRSIATEDGSRSKGETPGVPIPANLDMTLSVNLMDLMNRGRSRSKNSPKSENLSNASTSTNLNEMHGNSSTTDSNKPILPSYLSNANSDRRHQLLTETFDDELLRRSSSESISWGQNDGEYTRPGGRPPSKSPERPPFYFKSATFLPPRFT